MSGTSSTTWFWTDWLADQEVRRLTPAERGVWIDLLALASSGNPVGYVCDVKGKPLPLDEINRVVGADSIEALANLITAIVDKGAASRDRLGRVFNRRMAGKAALSKKRAKAGRKGGVATNSKSLQQQEKQILPQQNTRQKGKGMESSSFPGSLFTEEVVDGCAREKKKWPSDFRDRFWAEYPRRVEKSAAFRVLERVKAGGNVDFDELIAAVRRFASAMSTAELNFVCHPSVWLNKGRWDDDPNHINPQGNGNGHARPNSAAAAARRLHAEIIDQYGLGPEPGDFGAGGETGRHPLRLVSPG